MGARNRVGKGLSYRPARLHRLAELISWNQSIPWVLKSLKIRALYSLPSIFLPHREKKDWDRGKESIRYRSCKVKTISSTFLILFQRGRGWSTDRHWEPVPGTAWAAPRKATHSERTKVPPCSRGYPKTSRRVSSKQTKQKFGYNRNKPKQDLFRLCFGLFCVTKNRKFCFVLICFGVSNLYWNNWNKQNCFKTNRNKPKLP